MTLLADNVMMVTGSAEPVARIELGIIDYTNQFKPGEQLQRAVNADETQFISLLLQLLVDLLGAQGDLSLLQQLHDALTRFREAVAFLREDCFPVHHFLIEKVFQLAGL